MTSAASLARKIEKIENAIEKENNSKYVYRRDDKCNLYLKFNDGERFTLPVLPYRPYQIEAAKALIFENKKRILLSWPRRAGKEYITWNLIIQEAIVNPGTYMIVYPNTNRARSVLWDGNIMIMETGQIVPFKKMIPKKLVSSMNNQEMKIFLHNGSVIWVLGSDIDPDKPRGTNPRGIIFSEFAFSNPLVYQIMLPVLRQNGGWLICQSTFDGMNHFYRLIENNKKNPDWYCRVESVVSLIDENGNRYISDEMIDEDRRGGMPEYLIQQEYYGNVVINEETKYFSHAMNFIYENNRIISGMIAPNENAYAAWDLGKNDSTAVVIFQLLKVEGAFWPCIIGYIENNGKDFQFYVEEIRKFSNKNRVLVKSHYLPHDGRNQNYYDSLKISVDYLREMGEVGYIIDRPKSKVIAIEAMRRMLHRTKFNKENTERLIDCLSNYSKEFDVKLGTYKDKALHDWSSHGVDAYQTMTLAVEGDHIVSGFYEIKHYA